MKYPYDSKILSLDEVVEFIALVVYPTETKTVGQKKAVKNRVRGRIRDRQQKGDLPKGSTFEAAKFWSWAISVRKWRILKNVDCLPLEPVVHNVSLSDEMRFEDHIVAVAIPPDYEGLRERYVDVCKDLQTKSQALSELEKHAKQMTEELAEWRRKDRDMRRRNSENGRKRQKKE